MFVHFRKVFFLVWGGLLLALILSCSTVFAQRPEVRAAAPPSVTPQPSATEVSVTSTPSPTDSGSATMPDPNDAATNSGVVVGQIFVDKNRDRKYDPDELFLTDVVVILRDTATNGMELTITLPTDSVGAFRFANVPFADYVVSVDLPLAYGLLEGYEVARVTVGSADVVRTEIGVVRMRNDLYMPVIVR